MHEMSLIAGLFEILEEKAREHKARKVTAVRMRVGKLAGAVPEFLVTAFDMYKKGTLAEEASLQTVIEPVGVRCRSCANEFEVDDYVFHCPSCGAADLEILSGTELLLETIELETGERGERNE
ncbi:MAG: hydrogenase maturation nickel metallochaperone HypA [Candidatus Aminicenantes bacterium RBG_13_62_12]|nr:MAG: hydrogenase maturation nickel metallochaperone HypA [Candidatus Aminicenantes bacterium RBG_13_62_12]